MENRTILHLDMDAFFAAVEVVENPAYRGKPLIIGGDPESRNVVSTCSYEARKYGVHSAMPTFEAKRLCPHGIFVDGSHHLYKEYSTRVFDILHAMTHKVQPVSIDEAYIDVSDLDASGKLIARWLRERVLEKTGLTCSVGVASNKLVAKIASSIGKPDGLYEIPDGTEEAFLRPQKIKAIPGIGSKTEEVLYHDGIRTIGDMQELTLEELTFRYGQRGYLYFHKARGIDRSEVEWWEHAPKSIGAETTFPKDLDHIDEIEKVFDKVFKKAFRRLIKQGMLTRSLQLKMKNSEFKTITRSHGLQGHSKDEVVLLEESKKLLYSSYSGEPIRLIGICFEKLTDSYWQPLLF